MSDQGDGFDVFGRPGGDDEALFAELLGLAGTPPAQPPPPDPEVFISIPAPEAGPESMPVAKPAAGAPLEVARAHHAELAALIDSIDGAPGDEVRLFEFRRRLADCDRVLWRLGFKTFRTLVDSVDMTIAATSASRLEPPAELRVILRQTVEIVGALLEGRSGRRKTHYDLVETLARLREQIEEEISVERGGGAAAGPVAGPPAAAPTPSPETPGLTRIQSIFLREMGQHLNQMTRNLLLVEREPSNQEVIGSLMRSAHSIKGGGAVAKYEEIARFAHSLEDLLVVFRDHVLPMPGVAITLTLRAVDALQLLMEEAERGEASNPVATEVITRQVRELTEHLLANLDQFRNRQAEADASARQALRIEAATEEVRSRVETRYVNVDISQLDRLMNLAADLIINRTRLSASTGGVRAEVARLNDVRRAMLALGRRLEQSVPGAGGSRRGALHTGISGRPAAGDLLVDFDATEFSRFGSLDVLRRDLREEIARLERIGEGLAGMTSDVEHTVGLVSQIANDLHESITRIRMIPIGQVFERFPRAIRDLAESLGKRVTLDLRGGETPLDKTIVEEVSDPLMHLLRNAVDHGIESPAERAEAGKPHVGRLLVAARQAGSHVVIEIQDDGRGISHEKLRRAGVEKGYMTPEEAEAADEGDLMNLLVQPGFSTAREVTDVSGRGVGLDVVAGAVSALKGSLSISSTPGEGTTFTLRLPITLAITQALLFTAGGQRFALPLGGVLEIVSLNRTNVFVVEGVEVLSLRKSLVPLVDLTRHLGLADTDPNDRQVVIIGEPSQRTGLIVDSLIGREEIVVKSLGGHLRNVPFVSAGTILADGVVTLILDGAQLSGLTGEAHGRLQVRLRGAEAHDQAAPRPEKTRRSEPDGGDFAPPEVEEEQPQARATKRNAPARKPPAKQAGHARPSPSAPSPRRPSPLLASSRAAQAKHILVVDDAVSVRTYVTALLEGAGYRTTEACDGIDALEKLHRGRFDLVLTDLEMPRMHGFELIAEVKNTAHHRNIPIVILTGRMGEKHSRTGLELGAAAYLVKPFEDQQLIDTMARLLARTEGES